MAKKSKEVLSAEGRDIKDILSAAKQKEHAFALFHGKDDLIFKAHKTKSRSQMRQACKAEGASQKGAVGFLQYDGTLISMVVSEPSDPSASAALMQLWRHAFVARTCPTRKTSEASGYA